MKLSIVIPIHDQPRGAFFLSRLLQSLMFQTFQDFELVIVKEGGVGKNINAGIKKSKGELIKILCQDDWLAHPKSLEDIVNNFKGNWMITGSHDNRNPEWTDDLYLGANKLGGLSAMTLKNGDLPEFDENLQWMIDIDFYMKLYRKFGLPTILQEVNVNIGLHENQLTRTIPNEQKLLEHQLIAKKYE